MVAYFHGLESKQGGDKVKLLKSIYGDVYAPQMEYLKNPSLFDQVYNHLKNTNPNLLIGSSIGGYFSYWLGKKLGIDTILFNPALPYRTTFEPRIDNSGKKRSFNYIILGSKDTLIRPEDTVEWLSNNAKVSDYNIDFEGNGHRTPYNVFKKYIKKFG
jgi:predicted esterase YcpF (UPF0227 family)